MAQVGELKSHKPQAPTLPHPRKKSREDNLRKAEEIKWQAGANYIGIWVLENALEMKSCQLLSTGSSILAAAAKSLQSCPTLCDPIDGSPPGSPILGIPQARTQWSALPFPSPKHKSEKWKWSRSVMSNSLRPHGLQPTRLLRPWDFPRKSTGVSCHCLLQYPC